MEIEKIDIPTYSEEVTNLYLKYKKNKKTIISKKNKLKKNIEKLQKLKDSVLKNINSSQKD